MNDNRMTTLPEDQTECWADDECRTHTEAEDQEDGDCHAEAAVREEVHWALRRGYATRADLLEVADWTATSADWHWLDVDRIVEDEIARARRITETGPKVTDDLRLRLALGFCRTKGLFVGEDFCCCMGCAQAELRSIWEERSAREDGPMPYVYFHQQDVDHVIEGGPLHLAFGAIGTVGDVSDALRFLGRELTSTLRQCGLEVNWSGDIDRRIAVNLSWERRAPALD